ncbi:MAG: sensor histidine kinase [Planctomycetes bacterium]|nr:sensor histidine kinase [Planctomycetota bacterium]
MKRYFNRNLLSLSSGRSLKEMKDLEWIFIGIHAVWVPIAVLMGVLHDPASITAITILAVVLALWSVIAALLNHRITTVKRQMHLGIVTQVIISIFTWALIFQFVSGERTAAYGVFAIIIIEGAVRFGLIGSLILGMVAAVGQAAAMGYREWEHDIAFDLPGYLFWVILFLIIALSVGLVTEETRRERRRRERLIRERTLLEERHRIARDMHDTVLKTLHGLALESHALKKHLDSPVALAKIEYLQGVCQRSSQEIRDIIYELRTEDEDEGIASQVSRAVQIWSKATGIGTDFVISGEDRNLPLLVSYNLRNVLSEALVNIRKHADASKVDVSIELLPGELRMEIKDNGKGIGLSGDELYKGAYKGKYGILGMKERIEQLNGQFTAESGVGTRLVITVPLISQR